MDALTPAFPDLFAAITLFRAGEHQEAAKLLEEIRTGPDGKEAFGALFGLYVGALGALEVVGEQWGWDSEQFVQQVALVVEQKRGG